MTLRGWLVYVGETVHRSGSPPALFIESLAGGLSKQPKAPPFW
ncbi:hypothetical protein [uncultured Nostoc sp.]